MNAIYIFINIIMSNVYSYLLNGIYEIIFNIFLHTYIFMNKECINIHTIKATSNAHA